MGSCVLCCFKFNRPLGALIILLPQPLDSAGTPGSLHLSLREALRVFVCLQQDGGGALGALEPCDIHNALLNSLANNDIRVYL
jgi:hypothetical protein